MTRRSPWAGVAGPKSLALVPPRLSQEYPRAGHMAGCRPRQPRAYARDAERMCNYRGEIAACEMWLLLYSMEEASGW